MLQEQNKYAPKQNIHSARKYSNTRCYKFCCPNCGEDQVTHDSIVAFFRDEEGSPTGQTHLVLKEKVISFPKGDLASANPSKEADGLWIYFECKDCGKIPMITITQHNGRGYLYLGYEEQDANKDVEELKKAKKEAKEKGKGKSKK